MHCPSINRARHPAATIVAVLLWLGAAGPAAAALWVELDPTSGPAGTEVTGRTGGHGAFRTEIDPLRAFMVASAAADAVTTPDDTMLVEIGRLDIDHAGNGRISFSVPDVPPGRYVVMVFCPTCTPTSGGRSMLGVAEFEVTALLPSTDTVAVTASSRLDVVLLGAALLAAAMLATSQPERFGRRIERRTTRIRRQERRRSG